MHFVTRFQVEHVFLYEHIRWLNSGKHILKIANKTITTNPSTILKFWCWQNAPLHFSHSAADTDTKSFQERIRVEVSFVHLEQIHRLVTE